MTQNGFSPQEFGVLQEGVTNLKSDNKILFRKIHGVEVRMHSIDKHLTALLDKFPCDKHVERMGKIEDTVRFRTKLLMGCYAFTGTVLGFFVMHLIKLHGG